MAATAALALHARLIPSLSDDNLSGLAWHIRATALGIAFVVVVVLIRLGGVL